MLVIDGLNVDISPALMFSLNAYNLQPSKPQGTGGVIWLAKPSKPQRN